MERLMDKEVPTLGHNTHNAKLELLAPMMSPISMGTELNIGVSEDAFKLRLFSFSLGDKAHTLEKSLSPDSITTWDECKKAFLTKFFSTSRTTKLKNEISGFHQRNLEGFREAWERFNSYISQCPHQLSTFYRGALPKFRSQLDTASNGFFLGRIEADALDLVENMDKSDSVYSDEHARSIRGSRGDDTNTKRELKALQDKMDMLLLDRVKQEKVNFVGFPSQGNQSTQGQAGSSTSATQESSTDAMLKQILESQTRNEKHIGYELKNLHTKVDGSYNDLNNKFSNLASNFKALENQFASMSSNSKRPMGSLPGTSEQNPMETMKSITFRSSKQLPPRVLIRDNEKQDGGGDHQCG
ncbi:PREDICTED: uncharacterized protein LOC106338563 [Brassica oleracea var. oleracea]|uniref:uncharacterized protein LOC106338563 n=1 Tax=Brassica oleracea var. oleracea TaxID=109376 RepID=UPI0006A6AE3B|nr:PREDICTED: uncharacterized protein LOC106338563 [Brassica oleracea var. oleracea]